MSRECTNPPDGVDRFGDYKRRREAQEKSNENSEGSSMVSASSGGGSSAWPGSGESEAGKDVWATAAVETSKGGW